MKQLKIVSWLRSILSKVFSGDISAQQYDNMDEAIDEWLNLYYDNPPWLKKVNGHSLNLPAAIASEFARLIMVEFDVQITGSKRAEFLQQQFKLLRKKLRINLEESCAVGGILFKPYVKGGKIMTDCITQERFIPLEYNDDELTGVACLTHTSKGRFHFYRFEKQIYDDTTHIHSVTSKYYMSTDPNSMGKEIPPEQYPDGAVPDYSIRNVDRPLFQRL